MLCHGKLLLYKSKMQFGYRGLCRLQLRVFAQAEQKPDQQPEKQKQVGVQPAGNVTPPLRRPVKSGPAAMVALQADDLSCKKNASRLLAAAMAAQESSAVHVSLPVTVQNTVRCCTP